MKGNILLLGPSGSGKTTISKEILSNNLNYKLFVADTSRTKRFGEEEGVDYNFINSNLIIEQNKNIKFYLMEEYYKNYYGYNLLNFRKSKNNILTPGIKVADKILENMDIFGFQISILLMIDLKTFNERLKNRGETSEEIEKRKKSLELLDFKNKVDIVIDGNSSIDEIKKYLLTK